MCIFNREIEQPTSVKELSREETIEFIKQNGLLNLEICEINLGLFSNNDELISIMSIDHIEDNHWIIKNKIDKIGVKINNSCSMLFEYFLSRFNPKQVKAITFNDIDDGDEYKKIGFNKDSEIVSDWIVCNNFLSRKKYHPGAITSNHKEFRIFDSGQTKWIWRK